MAELGTSQSSGLFQDWYNQYVAPRKKPISLTSSAPQDFSLGLPTSPTPAPSAPVIPPVTPPSALSPVPTAVPEQPASVAPAATASDMATPTAAPAGSSWADRLGEGLKDPAKMGLLTAGLSMMATPPRQIPYSNTEILGQAGLAGVGMYEKALAAKRKDELMKQTAEEHKLTREDRRAAAEDRGQYYRDVAETRRMTAESLVEARKATTAENTVLDVPIDPKVATYYGVDPSMTVRTFNKMQSGLTAMAKPDKEPKAPDRYQNWRETFKAEKGRYPSATEEERFGKTEGAGADGPGKSAAITHINREMVTQYLDRARANITAKGAPGSAETKAMLDALNSQDPLTGGPNESKTFEALDPETRKEYNFVKRRSQVLSNTMVPAEAVAQAQQEYAAKNPPKATPKEKPLPPGAVRKVIKGKSYIKAADGKVYEE